MVWHSRRSVQARSCNEIMFTVEPFALLQIDEQATIDE